MKAVQQYETRSADSDDVLLLDHIMVKSMWHILFRIFMSYIRLPATLVMQQSALGRCMSSCAESDMVAKH